MKWFIGVRDLKELHKLYVKLLKEQFKNGVNFGGNEDKDIADIEGLQDVLSIICGLAGIEIELCGTWLWISGNTKAHKETLKKAGCFWASKKMQWYWHSKTAEKPLSRGKATIEYIRFKYGSQVINKDDVKKARQLENK